MGTIVNHLAPSMLSIDFGHMERDLKRVYAAGARIIHVDVMDGDFVPNISFGPPVIKYVRKALSDAFLDVHMMVREPVRYLDVFKKTGANGITIHYEATEDVAGSLEKIKQAGLKCGLAIKPGTPVTDILEYIEPYLDMVLVMSVEPGFGGQKFKIETLDKISAIRKYADSIGKDIDIEVDGGINVDNLQSILDAGANVIVAGSQIFEGDIENRVEQFFNIIRA